MPIIKSAKKRVKVAAKASTRNAKTKRTMREAIKALNDTLANGKTDDFSMAFRQATQAIDIAAKKNVIHKNKAARRKAQLAAQAKAAGMKPTKAAKITAKKATPKKAEVKKSASKKPTAKKS